MYVAIPELCAPRFKYTGVYKKLLVVYRSSEILCQQDTHTSACPGVQQSKKLQHERALQSPTIYEYILCVVEIHY
jgi:hypothetical protein